MKIVGCDLHTRYQPGAPPKLAWAGSLARSPRRARTNHHNARPSELLEPANF